MLLDKNFNRYAQKGDFMPVKGCHCLNMVSAVIDFYRRQPKRLKTIFLDHTHWNLFVEDLKRVDETYKASAVDGVPIENSDVTVKRGDRFQNKEMKYEFYTAMELAPGVISKIGEA